MVVLPHYRAQEKLLTAHVPEDTQYLMMWIGLWHIPNKKTDF